MKKITQLFLVIILMVMHTVMGQTKNDKKVKTLFEKGKVTSVRFAIPHGSYPANAQFTARILIMYEKNKTLELEGKNCLYHFDIISDGADTDSMGIIKIRDIHSLIRHSVVIKAISKDDRKYITQDTLKINYKDTLKISYDGKDGKPGKDGMYGDNGIRIAYRASGGTIGENGASGKEGETGQEIEIQVRYVYDSIIGKSLLKISTTSFTTSTKNEYLLDPDEGIAIISANGGNGGAGGKGGDGGDGQDAPCKPGYYYQGTPGGAGGAGGCGGVGGKGGKITILFDSLCINYMNHFTCTNIGGKGGNGGRPGEPGGFGQSYADGVPVTTPVNYAQMGPGKKGNDGLDGPRPVIKVVKLNDQ